MQRLDHHRRLRVILFQQPGALAGTGLTAADAEQAAWAIDTRGQRWRGAAAINAALAAALGCAWLLRLYGVPWIGKAQNGVYAWVARNRGRLPGITPYCSRPGAACVRREIGD